MATKFHAPKIGTPWWRTYSDLEKPMVLVYVDISVYQKQIDWQTYSTALKKTYGQSMVAIKAAEGVGYVDPMFAANRQGALAAGVDTIIYYSFARPDLHNSPIDEANYLWGIVGNGMRKQDMLMLDIEVAPPQGWCYQWLAQQEANSNGQLPVLYSYDAFIRSHLQDQKLTRYPLIVANYTYDVNARPACPPPWSNYVAIQYTDKAQIPGITTPVDANVWLGSLPQSSSGGTDIPMLQLTDPIGKYFTSNQAGDRWHCTKTNQDIAYALLTFYRTYGGVFGLPLTGEIYLQQYPNTALQYFERAIAVFDAKHTIDSPDGAGDCYLLHIDKGIGQQAIAKPLLTALQAQVDTLAKQVASLTDELTTLKAQPLPDTSALETQISDLMAQVAAYKQAVSSVEATIGALPK